MSFWYQVILKPSDVKFTSREISTKFKNGRLLQSLLDELKEGKQLVKDVPTLEVVWYLEKWDWYTLDNRLLWVFQELEKTGKISYIEMRRVEFISKVTDHPGNLYESAEVVDRDCEEPLIDRPLAVKSGKKGKDVTLLSKAFRRLQLYKYKATVKESSSQSETKREKGDGAGQLVENSDCGIDAPCPKEVQQKADTAAAREVDVSDGHNFGMGSGNTTDNYGDGIIDLEIPNGHLEPMGGTTSVTPLDVERGSDDAGLTSPHKSIGLLIKEEAGENVENDNVEDVLSICHSRSPSVCSSACDSRGIDDWGRKDQKPPSNWEDSGQPSEDDWIEIECDGYLDDDPVFEDDKKAVDENGNVVGNSFDVGNCAAKEAVKEWLNDRKRFINSSKDSHFHEYVVDRIDPKRPKQSLSESLLSLDSAFSNSLSVISREQRQISEISGLSGYGSFDKYNTEYLSKLRSQRLACKRRLKPYDVSGSRRVRARTRKMSLNGDDNQRQEGYALRKCSGTTFCTEERVRRRIYSETINISGRKTHRFRSVSNSVSSCSISCFSNDDRMHRRGRSRSENDYSYLGSRRRSTSSITRNRQKTSSCSFSGASLDSFHDYKKTSFNASLKNHALSKEKLYSFWKMRREDYMEARYRGSLSRGKSRDSLALTGYTCGLCFKSFQSRTRREQHSDELMHWACITCGRFFASHTALGQHVDEMGHRKD